MRDIGAIVWVLLVVIGVVSSIVSNARKQMARSAAPPQRQAPLGRPSGQAPRPAMPAQPARRQMPVHATAADVRESPAPAGVRSQPPPPPVRVEAVVAHDRLEPRPHPLPRLFRDRRSLVRAVIAAEVLGKPLALRDGG